jgi:predicted RNase H-like HicB family nuclease
MTTNVLGYLLTITSYPEETGYLAYFPALPGSHSWGVTNEDALRNAQEALIGYLEALQKNGEIPPSQQP